MILDGLRPCPWDEETIVKALSLRSRLSRRQYQFLRETGQPLPSLTTLNTRLQQFSVQQGSADTAAAVLQRHLRDRPVGERLCVLMFDEMKVSTQIMFT